MRTNMKIKKRIRYIYFSTYNNYNLCINYYYCRTLNLYENTLYSNNVSYPFIDLSIEIDPDYNVTVNIEYIRKGQLKIATITNKNSIDMDCIKKELKVSELKPEKQFKDSLSFYFSIKKV